MDDIVEIEISQARHRNFAVKIEPGYYTFIGIGNNMIKMEGNYALE
jgi:hypothetical protein